MIAGTMVFGACKKDEDPVATPADTTKPTITVTSPTDGQTITAGDMLSIAGKAMDNSNLKSFSVNAAFAGNTLIDTVTTISGKEHSFTQTLPTTGWPAGAYTFTFTSTDAANNVSAATVVNVTIKAAGPVDNEKPKVNSVSITIPSGNKLNSNFENRFNVKVTENMALDYITVEVFNLHSGSPVSIGMTKVENSSITDPKSFDGEVRVNLANLGGSVLNWDGKIVVKAYDKAGNIGELEKLATIEY